MGPPRRMALVLLGTTTLLSNGRRRHFQGWIVGHGEYYLQIEVWRQISSEGETTWRVLVRYRDPALIYGPPRNPVIGDTLFCGCVCTSGYIPFGSAR